MLQSCCSKYLDNNPKLNKKQITFDINFGSPNLAPIVFPLFHGIICPKGPLFYVIKLLSLKAIPLIPEFVHNVRDVSIGPPCLIRGM